MPNAVLLTVIVEARRHSPLATTEFQMRAWVARAPSPAQSRYTP